MFSDSDNAVKPTDWTLLPMEFHINKKTNNMDSIQYEVFYFGFQGTSGNCSYIIRVLDILVEPG